MFHWQHKSLKARDIKAFYATDPSCVTFFFFLWWSLSYAESRLMQSDGYEVVNRV